MGEMKHDRTECDRESCALNRARVLELERVLLSRHGGEPIALLAELDEQKARVLELERMYADMKEAADRGSKSVFALAASQAECAEAKRRLREVVAAYMDGKTCAHAFSAPCPACDAQAVLSRSPGSMDALREVAEKLATEAWDRGYATAGEAEYSEGCASDADERAKDVRECISKFIVLAGQPEGL